MREYFWSVTVRCACSGCHETAAVDQPGSLPQGWIGVIINEKLPVVAITPAEVIREQARYETRPYPVCSAACGAKLLIARAFAQVRTKAEGGALKSQLREVLDGDRVRPRPS